MQTMMMMMAMEMVVGDLWLTVMVMVMLVGGWWLMVMVMVMTNAMMMVFVNLAEGDVMVRLTERDYTRIAILDSLLPHHGRFCPPSLIPLQPAQRGWLSPPDPQARA